VAHHNPVTERKLIYVWEDDIAHMKAANERLQAALKLGLKLARETWPMSLPESEPEKSVIAFINAAEGALSQD
jgi:hypothetical protein